MRLALMLSLVAAAGLAACASAPPAPAAGSFPPPGTWAVATLSPTATSGVNGIVVFSDTGTAVDVRVTASGLPPGSVHGFHVHENGNCASADFASAGGHFNPTHQPHGPQDKAHHAGDMPSLQADAGGKVDAHFTLEGVSLGGPAGLLGHAVILHAMADDFTTQPTGNSGGRVACGVIATP